MADAERFTVFLADPRAGIRMALEDGAWQDEELIPNLIFLWYVF